MQIYQIVGVRSMHRKYAVKRMERCFSTAMKNRSCIDSMVSGVILEWIPGELKLGREQRDK